MAIATTTRAEIDWITQRRRPVFSGRLARLRMPCRRLSAAAISPPPLTAADRTDRPSRPRQRRIGATGRRPSSRDTRHKRIRTTMPVSAWDSLGLVTHYWANAGLLEEGILLRGRAGSPAFPGF